MEKFYTVHDGYAEIILNHQFYPLVSIKKALSNFMNPAYIKMDQTEENKTIINIALKQESDDSLEKIIGEFYNELLRESLRYDIAMQTKNIRELIIGRALYTTCIDVDEEENDVIENEEDYDINEIAVNWFDKYGNKEE